MIVAVVNTKGGVGKTTTVMYLAEAATRAGRTARVWDVDPQGSALVWSDLAEDAGGVGFTVEGIHRRRLREAATVDGDVFIDTPPGDPQTISEAIAAADVVLVATGPGGADIDRTLETMRTYQTASAAMLLLVTQWVRTETDSWETWQSIQHSDLPAFDTRIPRRAAIQKSFGQPIAGDIFGYDRLLKEITDVHHYITTTTGD